MKRIILCADDYGQSHAISQAIIDLVKAKRLSAVSCMVTTADWPVYAKQLISYKHNISIGLHFNLTEGNFLSNTSKGFSALPSLLLKSHFRWLSKRAIGAELNAQLDRFTDTMGMLPDFIDGHQHIHHFPVIRDVLLEIYEEKLRKHGCCVRSVYSINQRGSFRSSAYLKKMIIQLSGAAVFNNRLVKKNILHNTSFSGIYSWDNNKDYATLFGDFLQATQDGGLIMCHPGWEDTDESDVISHIRPTEYAFLGSDFFLKLLDEYHVRLVTFKELKNLNS